MKLLGKHNRLLDKCEKRQVSPEQRARLPAACRLRNMWAHEDGAIAGPVPQRRLSVCAAP